MAGVFVLVCQHWEAMEYSNFHIPPPDTMIYAPCVDYFHKKFNKLNHIPNKYDIFPKYLWNTISVMWKQTRSSEYWVKQKCWSFNMTRFTVQVAPICCVVAYCQPKSINFSPDSVSCCEDRGSICAKLCIMQVWSSFDALMYISWLVINDLSARNHNIWPKNWHRMPSPLIHLLSLTSSILCDRKLKLQSRDAV